MSSGILSYFFLIGLCVVFELRQIWLDRKEEMEGREVIPDLERIFRWFESLSSRRR